MAGGPSTPELVAAVCAAGGAGVLAGGYKSALDIEREITATRELLAAHSRPGSFGVNLFVPHDAYQGRDQAAVEAYRQRLGAGAGRVNWGDDDGWFDKLALLTMVDPVDLVSFTFGCPEQQVVAELQAVGSRVAVTVTDVDEAQAAADAGADLLVVQGADAGGHRGTHEVDKEPNHLDALALLPQIGRLGLPMIAAGGVATSGDVRRALAAGAVAVQCGTAFLLCPEAGTSAAHRRLVESTRGTVTTRAFSGRVARGVRNAFIDEHDAFAPAVFPQVDQLTKPIRRAAAARGDAELISAWAGIGAASARAIPAAEVLDELAPRHS